MNAEALGAVGDEENLGPMPYNLIVATEKLMLISIIAVSELVVTLSTS